VSTEILTLVLTGITVRLAFKYINRDQERSSKEKTVAWLKSVKLSATAWLITLKARSKELIRERCAKVPDPESPRQDELQESTTRSSESSDPRMSIRSRSTSSWLAPRRAASRHRRSVARSSMSDSEPSSQDELQESTTSSSETSDPETTQHSPQVQHGATPIRCASAATLPVGRTARLKHPHSRGRGRVVDPGLSRQGEPQEPTSSSENPNPATAPHTPWVQDEATSIRSV
jgi:hypothetical protein